MSKDDVAQEVGGIRGEVRHDIQRVHAYKWNHGGLEEENLGDCRDYTVDWAWNWGTGKLARLNFRKTYPGRCSQRVSGSRIQIGMPSRGFIRKYNSCEFEEENLEFMEWAGYYYIADRMGLIEAIERA